MTITDDQEEEYIEMSPKVKIKIAPSDKKHYVNAKVFRDQLSDYYESDVMTNELAINVMKIAEGLSYNFRFINYTKSWREDMVGDATIKMYAALESKKFRIESEFSPFAYFNRIAWNAFCNRIKKEKKQHEGLQEYKGMMYEDMMSNPSCNGHVYVKPILECDLEDGHYED